MKTYEGMFLLDAGTADFDAAFAPVREALSRIQAEILTSKPWDERRLAYDIAGRRRGLYVLTYFKAQPQGVAALQHEVQLDERILRALVLSADHLADEVINAETPATLSMARKAAAEAQKAAREKERAEAAGAKEAPKAEPPQTAAAKEAPKAEPPQAAAAKDAPSAEAPQAAEPQAAAPPQPAQAGPAEADRPADTPPEAQAPSPAPEKPQSPDTQND